MRARGVLAAPMLALMFTTTSAWAAEAPATFRVSVSSAGQQGDASSRRPSISADGNLIAFSSEASNLVPGDTNGVADVFVHDRRTGSTIRVSVGRNGVQSNGASSDAAISGDGRIVAFTSWATDLDEPDVNGVDDVYLHDLATGATERVSRAPGGEPNGGSREPSISRDGRYVAFVSDASNLARGDANGLRDVYVRDRVTGLSTLESARPDGFAGDGPSDQASISGDGSVVAFRSEASDLVRGDTRICLFPGFPFPRFGNCGDVFARDRSGGLTTWLSAPRGPSAADWSPMSDEPSVSPDGRYVAFASGLDNLGSVDTNESIDIYRYDLSTGAIQRVSIGLGGTEPFGASWEPSIAAGGRSVAFLSSAPNHVAGDANGRVDVFVRDLLLGITRLASVSTTGLQGSGAIQGVALAGNTSAVAFGTGSVLDPADTNGVFDAYVRVLGPVPPV